MDYLFWLHLKPLLVKHPEPAIISLGMFGEVKVSRFQKHVQAVTVSNKWLRKKKQQKKTTETESRIELSLNGDSKSTVYPGVSLEGVIWRSPVLFPVKKCLSKDKKMLISPALVRTWPRWTSRGGFLTKGTPEMWYFSPSDLLNGLAGEQ